MSTAPTRAPRPGAPGSPWRPVAVVSALALGAIGAAAAPRLGFPAALGAVAGGLAAILAVVALPSLPTRRVAVVMLGLAGLGALRHAALPTTDSALIVLWAGATLVALVLVDRAQAERIPQLAQGRPLAPRVPKRCGWPRSSPRSWSSSRSRSCRRSPTTSAGACGPARCRRSATGSLRPAPSGRHPAST